MKRPADDDKDAPEDFLRDNDYPPTDQIIIEYAKAVRVVFWPDHDDYPQVWYHGRVVRTKEQLEEDPLVANALDQLGYADLRAIKLAYGYKRVLLLKEMYRDNDMIEEIAGESTATEIDDILDGNDVLTISFHHRTRVELRTDGPKFLTIYGQCDSTYGDKCAEDVINVAWELFRDPHTKWSDGVATWELFDDYAFQCQTRLKNNILEKYAKPGVNIYYNSNVRVHLSTVSQHLYYKRKIVDDFDVLVEKSIELLPTMPRGENITFATLEGDLKILVHQLESLHVSTAEYCITNNKYEVLGYLGLNKYKFSVQHPRITVHYDDWRDRTEFERHQRDNIALVYKDLVFDGTVVPALKKSENLRVYFTEFKRYYYFFIHERGQQWKIRISGVPDHRGYVIKAYIKESSIVITSFFNDDTVKRDTIKSVNFRGTGPRGMLLVKYIAQRLGARDAYLEDAWHIGKNDTSMNSKLLQQVLSKNMDMDELSIEHEWFEAHREKIANWKKFYEERGTLDLAMNHGYYGGFGFENYKDSKVTKHANVDSIECAAYMSRE